MNEILVGDVREKLRELPDESVHCVITSPPYWGLRDYGTATWKGGDPSCSHRRKNVRPDHSGRTITGRGLQASAVSSATPYKGICRTCGAKRVDRQIGLEETPQAYVDLMVEIFREIRRVLRKDGTLWLNMGDCYAGSGKGRMEDGRHSKASDKQSTNRGSISGVIPNLRDRRDRRSPLHTSGVTPPPDLKPKDLVGMPWRIAFALQADGWWLRRDIIWEKPNPMPESVRDRPTTAHEYIFLLTKSLRYFYDDVAVRERATGGAHGRGEGMYSKLKYPAGWDPETGYQSHTRRVGRYHNKTNERFARAVVDLVEERSKRSVWEIPSEAFKDAHFATFPQKLVETCIMAGTSEKGCCAICGVPWVRLIKNIYLNPGNRSGNGIKWLGRQHKDFGSAVYDKRRVRSTTTVGWEPRCACSGKLIQRKVVVNGIPETVTIYKSKLPLEKHPVRPCVVLDPFIGSGTVAFVAERARRHWIGIELNKKYVKIANRRLHPERSQGRLF